MQRSLAPAYLACVLATLLAVGSAGSSEWASCSVNDRDEPITSDRSAVDQTADQKLFHKLRGPYRPADVLGQGIFASKAEPIVECTSVSVPLNWDDNESRNITWFMKRFTPPRGAGSAKGNVWVIDGGPGGAGGLINDLAYALYSILGDEYNVYVPHHRGTGYSTRLGCPNEFRGSNCSQELNEQYGDELHFFSTTMAARDLAFAIKDVSVAEQTNIVYGISYGTYLLNRFMLLYPTLASKVILDGVCPSTKCRILSYDTIADTVAEQFYERCSDDATCSSKLGNKASALFNVENFLKMAKEGQYCVERERPGYTDGDFRIAFFSLQSSELLRELWPAFIYRAKRCNSDDKTAILKFFDDYLVNYKGSAPAKPRIDEPILYSESLGNNIRLSELYNDGEPIPSCERVYSDADIGYSAVYISYESCILKPYWNTYVPDEYHNQFASGITVPVLLMNGDLDSATPLDFANLVYDKYRENGFSRLQYVVFEEGVHALGIFSKQTSSDIPCGLEIVASFVKSDSDRFDSTCLAKRITIDFVPETERVKSYSKQYFGTENLWGDSKQPEPGNASSAHLNSSCMLFAVLMALAGLFV